LRPVCGHNFMPARRATGPRGRARGPVRLTYPAFPYVVGGTVTGVMPVR
jgi:hypothetical protein